MLRQAQEQIYKEIIYKNYNQDPASQNIDPVLQTQVDEVIDALALGCTLARPRRFGNNLITAEDFRSIARKFNSTICAVACDALYDNKNTVRNRTFYVLGILARFRDTDNPRDVRYIPTRWGYNQRIYSKNQIESCITNIEDITDDMI